MNAIREEYAEKRKSYADALVARGKAGQAAVLERQLKAGVSIVYQDEHGNFVEEHPDRTITILKTKEEL